MSHISTSARSATWGDDLVLKLFHSGGGLKGAVDRIRDVVGPIVGTTRAYEGQHDLRAVQLLLGHSSLMTTQVYLDTGSSSMRTALGFAA